MNMDLLKVQKVDIKLDYHSLNKLVRLLSHLQMGIKKFDLGISLGEEYDFIEEYQNSIEPEIKKHSIDASARRDRLNKFQMEVFQRVEEDKRIAMQKQDEEYSQKLVAEERRKLEEEKKQKKQQEEREYAILSITSMFQNVDYDQAVRYLEQEQWNTKAVIAFLERKYADEKKEEERQINVTLMMLERFPSMDYEMAQSLLIAANWDVNTAISQHQQQSCYRLNFNIQVQNGLFETHTGTFDYNDFGMGIINFLISKKNPNNQYYRIYKDNSFNNEITYLQMSNPISQLGLVNGQNLYVKLANEPSFN